MSSPLSRLHAAWLCDSDRLVFIRFKQIPDAILFCGGTTFSTKQSATFSRFCSGGSRSDLPERPVTLPRARMSTVRVTPLPPPPPYSVSQAPTTATVLSAVLSQMCRSTIVGKWTLSLFTAAVITYTILRVMHNCGAFALEFLISTWFFPQRNSRFLDVDNVAPISWRGLANNSKKIKGWMNLLLKFWNSAVLECGSSEFPKPN
ncbi:hypothetical protein J6590_007656 [Homalodisca vitripennis]|nr:hypothetical protein J6590_007656 [Homalodisca vitripennis]